MTRTPAPTALPDPDALNPVEWSTRLAAYLGRGRADDDPAVIQCRQALAYWRCRRVLDAEAGRIGTTGATALLTLIHNTQAVAP